MSTGKETNCSLCGETRSGGGDLQLLEDLLDSQQHETIIGAALVQMVGLGPADVSGQLVCGNCYNKVLSFKAFILNCRKQRGLKKTPENEGTRPEDKTLPTGQNCTMVLDSDIDSSDNAYLNSDFLDNLIDSATFKSDSYSGELENEGPEDHDVINSAHNDSEPVITSCDSIPLNTSRGFSLTAPVTENQSESISLVILCHDTTCPLESESQVHPATSDLNIQAQVSTSFSETLESDLISSQYATKEQDHPNSCESTCIKQGESLTATLASCLNNSSETDSVVSTITMPVGTVKLQKPTGGAVYILPDGTTLEMSSDGNLLSPVTLDYSTVTPKGIAEQQSDKATSHGINTMALSVPKVQENNFCGDESQSMLSATNTSQSRVASNNLRPRSQIIKLPPESQPPPKRRRGRPSKQEVEKNKNAQKSRQTQMIMELIQYASHGKSLVPKCNIVKTLKCKVPAKVDENGRVAIPRLQKPAVLPALPILLPKAGVAPPSPHHCPKCNIVFVSNEDLKSHVSIHEGIESCPVCWQPFVAVQDLHQHLRNRHPTHICHKDQCNYYSGKSYAVKIHTKLHSLEKDHHCNLCKKSFKTESYLKQHKARRHSKKTMIECPLCDKKFKWQVSLKYHLRFHNHGYHECSECEKKFQFEESLRRHVLAIHKDVSIHRCDVCDKRFTDNHTKTNHWKTHFKDKYKIYRCSVPGCKFREYNEYRVTAHVLKVHDKVLPPRRKSLDLGLCHFCGMSVTSLSRHLRLGICGNIENRKQFASQAEKMFSRWMKKPDGRTEAEKIIHSYEVLLEKTNAGGAAELGQLDNNMSLADLQQTIARLRQRLIQQDAVHLEVCDSNDVVGMEIEVKTQEVAIEGNAELSRGAPSNDEPFIPSGCSSEEVVPSRGVDTY